MTDKIIQSAQTARVLLNQIRQLPGDNLTEKLLLEHIKKAVCLKLMIPETEETSLNRLLISSILMADDRAGGTGHPSPGQTEQLMHKTDCHRISLLVHKKVLLILFIEKELNIKFTDEEASSIEDTRELASLALKYLKGCDK